MCYDLFDTQYSHYLTKLFISIIADSSVGGTPFPDRVASRSSDQGNLGKRRPSLSIPLPAVRTNYIDNPRAWPCLYSLKVIVTEQAKAARWLTHRIRWIVVGSIRSARAWSRQRTNYGISVVGRKRYRFFGRTPQQSPLFYFLLISVLRRKSTRYATPRTCGI